ncbi:for, partial [Symbiodinium sp. KB8]
DAGLWLLGGSYFRKLVREHSEKTQKENLRLLEQVHVLDGLSNAQKSHVGSVALLNETFTAGSVVAESGEECKRLWVVKKGTLSVVDGGERIGKKLSGGDKVREVCAGGCFGEQYLKIDASKRIEVNLVAATDCDVVCVLIDKLASLLGEGDVAQLLERAYVGLTLRHTPWFESLPAQDKSHVLHTQVTIEPCREGQAVSSLQRVGSMPYLVLVVEGTFHDSADGRRHLERGGWAQAEDFDRLQMLCSSKAYESPKASAKRALRPDRLVAGETGGRIALVPLEGIARSLSGDMELPEPAELMDYISKVLIISRLPVLKRLANFQVCSISKALDSTDPWRPGEIVFDQGEDGDKFYIVMSGGVRVDVDGVLLRELGKGACFGERALLFDEKRSGKVTVTEPDTRFWVGTRDVFEKFVTKNMRDDLRERAKLQDWTLSLKNLRHVRMIGVGAFGSVRLVEHVKTGARYALKRIKKEDGQVPMEIQEECNLLGMASHPFVLQLVKSFQTEKSLYILTELITGGQLYEQMRDKMGTASRRHAQFYTGSLVLILEALHLAGVAYRDLKPENVMLDSQGYVKLVDFGLAKDMRDQSKTFTIVGTVYYMAPDIFAGRGYGLEVDYWSLGIMLYELVCGRLPFGNESAEEDDIIAAVLEETLAFPPKYNDNAGKNLMERLLCKDPAERIGSRDGWQEVKEPPECSILVPIS